MSKNVVCVYKHENEMIISKVVEQAKRGQRKLDHSIKRQEKRKQKSYTER